MDVRSKILAMLGIRIMAKLGGMTHQVEHEDKSRGKRKAMHGRHNLME